MTLIESRLFDPSDGEETPFGDPITTDFLAEVESVSGIWTATPQLQYIAAEAARKGVNPWGLLALVQEHRATHVPPNVVLVGKDGTPGNTLVGGMSLNGFVALVAEPGGGKSVTFQLATETLPPASIPVPTGTGQGMVRNLAKSETRTKDEEKKPLPKPVRLTVFRRHDMMVHAPEVKALNAEFLRDGAQTDSIMRSMWVGETVGMTNADTDRRVVIPPNMVRVCGAWGVQPVNAGAILAQAADGTPQRFLWVPAEEYRHPSRPPAPQGITFPMPTFVTQGPFGSNDMPWEIEDGEYAQLPQPIWVTWSPKMHAEIPQYHARLQALRKKQPYERISEEHRARREAAAMKRHLLLLVIKQAVKMGWTHGRATPDDLDWALAKAQCAISAAELAGVWQETEDARARLSRKRGEELGITRDAADQTVKVIVGGRLSALAEKLHGYLCHKPHTAGELRERISNPETKQLVDAALNHLKKEGRAEIEDCGRGKILWHALIAGERVAA